MLLVEWEQKREKQFNWLSRNIDFSILILRSSNQIDLNKNFVKCNVIISVIKLLPKCHVLTPSSSYYFKVIHYYIILLSV